MFIKVRNEHLRETEIFSDLSKSKTKIKDIKKLIQEKWDVPTDGQRLIYMGKQLEDGYTLFDYDIQQNSIIMFIKRQILKEVNTNGAEDSTSEKGDAPASKTSSTDEKKSEIEYEETESEYFKLNEFVDVKDMQETGAFFEAQIIRILRRKVDDPSAPKGMDGLEYEIKYERYADDDPVKVLVDHIRPRAHKVIPFEEITVGQTVLASCNQDSPKDRGFWYDCEITEKFDKRNKKYLKTKVLMGPAMIWVPNCKLNFVDDILAIEKTVKISDRPADADYTVNHRRVHPPQCTKCNDDPAVPCKSCNCNICGGKEEPEKQLICDECQMAFHLKCLDPPLEEMPEDDEDWYCPGCKIDTSEIVMAGGKLKASKKKKQMASAQNNTKRDWGKGMATAGRDKICTKVPPNHFGPIPGIEVGMCWKFRTQVSGEGVHRPHVAGIAGRANEGCFSVVLSGGYEDDVDNGEEFLYTGSGGRDLSGNKRTAEQSCDQELTKTNLGIAVSCAAKVNTTDGNDAGDNWKKGKPIRVCRNYKLTKHSKYAPEEGNRYDGIYKVVKYWPEKGKAGYLVWRYLFRRDDPTPAPWTKEGTERIKKMGFSCIYPDGFLEAEAAKAAAKAAKDEGKENDGGKNKGGKKKRKAEEAGLMDSFLGRENAVKKPCTEYKIDAEYIKLINSDERNKGLWSQCIEEHKYKTRLEFFNKIEEVFRCAICMDMVAFPVTTPCGHNACRGCLKRGIKCGDTLCPTCRTDLTKDFECEVNADLREALRVMFPGCEDGRS